MPLTGGILESALIPPGLHLAAPPRARNQDGESRGTRRGRSAEESSEAVPVGVGARGGAAPSLAEELLSEVRVYNHFECPEVDRRRFDHRAAARAIGGVGSG